MGLQLRPRHGYQCCGCSQATVIKREKSITKFLDEACRAWGARGQLGDQPSGLARPGWLRPCPGRPGWLDLEAPGASGSPWLVRCGLEWLDLGALGALAGSLWTPWALLARPGWPTTAPSTRLAKKNRFAFRRSCFDAACFVRSGTFLHASKLVDNIMQIVSKASERLKGGRPAMCPIQAP